jgi:hypothetical protein
LAVLLNDGYGPGLEGLDVRDLRAEEAVREGEEGGLVVARALELVAGRRGIGALDAV